MGARFPEGIIMTSEDRTPRSFHLMNLKPGQVLEVKCLSSTFWITRTISAYRIPKDKVSGFAVQTDNLAFGQVACSPIGYTMGAQVTVGNVLKLGSRGHTGTIVSMRVL